MVAVLPIAEPVGRKGFNLLLVAVLLAATCFYVLYVFKAWFHQDDFVYLDGYRELKFWQLFDIKKNFGRFVSRNLYWHVVPLIFGNSSQWFFLLNFAVILGAAVCIGRMYFLLTGQQGKGHVLAVIYVCSAPVLASYAWLSNNQHLPGHFFLFSCISTLR